MTFKRLLNQLSGFCLLIKKNDVIVIHRFLIENVKSFSKYVPERKNQLEKFPHHFRCCLKFRASIKQIKLDQNNLITLFWVHIGCIQYIVLHIVQYTIHRTFFILLYIRCIYCEGDTVAILSLWTLLNLSSIENRIQCESQYTM